MSTSQKDDRKPENMAEMTDGLGIKIVPAAWRSGVAGLAEAINAQSCPADEICRDWLMRAPARLQQVPPFCPHAASFNAATADQRPRRA